MIRLARADLDAVLAAAETAYPGECCGLLAGKRDADGGIRVTEVVPSPNIVEKRLRDRFEVDPQIRFDLMRRLRGSGTDIVGHYHSHPDQVAEPSAHDLAKAFETDLIWLIVPVAQGKAGPPRAHLADPAAGGFTEFHLEIAEPRRPKPLDRPPPTL